MKKLVYIAAFVAASLSAYAQGTIIFNNRVAGGVLDAPVFDQGGSARLAGTGFFAQLYAGPASAADSALVAVGSPVNFRTGTGAGYVVAPAADVDIPGVAAGQTAKIQLRAWAGAAGSTFAGASIKGSSASFVSQALGGDPGGGAPPATSPFLIGLTSFSLVPEPSTIALGALGVAALLLRRRK